jgi:hypothetical protein
MRTTSSRLKTATATRPAIWIDWVELEGPLPEGESMASATYRIEPEKTINPQNEKSIKELEDSFSRFTKWQKGVDEAAKTPENKAIIAEIAKKEKEILDPTAFLPIHRSTQGYS